MAEIDIPLEDIVTLVEHDKGRLCAVKHCRNPHLKHRKLCSKCKQRVWRVRNPGRNSYHQVKSRASRKNISFSLTYDEFMAIAEASGYLDAKGRGAEQLHIDRINARLGYSVENVRVITASENSRKGCYEKKIQLGDGRWVMLHEIGIGLPSSESPEEDDWIDQSTLSDIDWGSDTDSNCPF